MDNAKPINYYELLMISTQADRAMIEWAVRLMLARFTKNKETADPQKVELVKEAFRTLCDPNRRKAYDARLFGGAADRRTNSVPARISEETGLPINKIDVPDSSRIRLRLTATAEDVRLLKKLRQAVMSAIYDIMLTRPRHPELGRNEIARAVGVRADDLEFAIWYLREQRLLRTTSQGGYSITVKGVEWVESGGVEHLGEESGPRVVENPKRPAAAG